CYGHSFSERPSALLLRRVIDHSPILVLDFLSSYPHPTLSLPPIRFSDGQEFRPAAGRGERRPTFQPFLDQLNCSFILGRGKIAPFSKHHRYLEPRSAGQRSARRFTAVGTTE